MKKIISICLFVNCAFSLNGTITFYDGTTINGSLSSSDLRHVIITPIGLVIPEKIPVADIDNLKLDNGLILIEDGVAMQTYLDGKFSVIQREKNIEDSPQINEPYSDYELGNLDYFSISIFYGKPIYFRPSLLLNGTENPTSLPNLGLDFSLPYLPIGPVNVSVGGRLITFGFDKEFGTNNASRKIKSITFAGVLKTDLKPILDFLGDNIHPTIETGISYSLGWEENYNGGMGILIGGTVDYWIDDSPIGLRIFSNGYMIPTPDDALTGFGNIGASLLLSLRRND